MEGDSQVSRTVDEFRIEPGGGEHGAGVLVVLSVQVQHALDLADEDAQRPRLPRLDGIAPQSQRDPRLDIRRFGNIEDGLPIDVRADGAQIKVFRWYADIDVIDRRSEGVVAEDEDVVDSERSVRVPVDINRLPVDVERIGLRQDVSERYQEQGGEKEQASKVEEARFHHLGSSVSW